MPIKNVKDGSYKNKNTRLGKIGWLDITYLKKKIKTLNVLQIIFKWYTNMIYTSSRI